MPAADPRPDVFSVGDCVVAIYAIGLFRTRVPRGTRGEVAGLAPAGEVEVHFANGRVELVPPTSLAHCAAYQEP
ncbi:MAG: hypothetical protein M3N95_10980 [Actinomycetota bacterium]|nr:hypothetical protein [Actinomycetota bacterium]